MLFIAAYFSLLSPVKQYAAPWVTCGEVNPGITSGPGWGWKMIVLIAAGEGNRPPDGGMGKGDF